MTRSGSLTSVGVAPVDGTGPGPVGAVAAPYDAAAPSVTARQAAAAARRGRRMLGRRGLRRRTFMRTLPHSTRGRLVLLWTTVAHRLRSGWADRLCLRVGALPANEGDDRGLVEQLGRQPDRDPPGGGDPA